MTSSDPTPSSDPAASPDSIAAPDEGRPHAPAPSGRSVGPLGLLAALLLFTVSGAVGLVYEVSWTRRLLLLLGSTTTASAVVLAAFLAGLGLGARLGGRLADRARRPLVLYGALEVLGAAWAFLVTVIIAVLEARLVAAAMG